MKRTSVSGGLQVVAPGRKSREKGTRRRRWVNENGEEKGKGSAQFDYRPSFVQRKPNNEVRNARAKVQESFLLSFMPRANTRCIVVPRLNSLERATDIE